MLIMFFKTITLSNFDRYQWLSQALKSGWTQDTRDMASSDMVLAHSLIVIKTLVTATATTRGETASINLVLIPINWD